jgi:hypothetical protein
MTKIVSRLATIACAAFLFAGTSAAQDPPTASHVQAAVDLMKTLHTVDVAESGAEAMLVSVRANPDLAPYEDVFRDWFKKVIEDGEFESEIRDLYVAHFTEEELHQIDAFYRTPLGQKTLDELPAIMREGAELGQQLAQKHLPELHEALEKARAERHPTKNEG